MQMLHQANQNVFVDPIIKDKKIQKNHSLGTRFETKKKVHEWFGVHMCDVLLGIH